MNEAIKDNTGILTVEHLIIRDLDSEEVLLNCRVSTPAAETIPLSEINNCEVIREDQDASH